MRNKIDLKNLTFAQLTEQVEALGIPPARARHIFSWLYRPGLSEFARMKDIKQEIRELLAAHCFISRLTPSAVERSTDGTVKFLFKLADGAMVESVLIPEEGRHTLCVSSQAGCAMGCKFCLTGALGLERNLQPAEIVGQVMAALDYLLAAGVERATHKQLVNNLVFMGMGEPLANYDNLLAALNILMDERGLEFTGRRVTVSTCGLVPRIIDLGRDTKVNLAVSLHAADDDTRSRLMPVNRRHGLDGLLGACRAFPLGKKKVILIEYILIKGINDSSADARLLAEKLQGIACRINLLPYNESAALDYQCPAEETILRFQKVLREAGFTTLIRQSRGADIGAACGQLAGATPSNKEH
ncbi:MAG: 23S rRNA (adenine(2503)-C(2))-methyltransferase RlmN [Desulfobulbaceae bacterium]|nr:23S rRNA (adenine(2503)-C(2))-methyltransferase RlmN [Desulfobulbaceae bacterium]HIJ78936.1 23S rRNA (adenine(2503)-C(2))-methyltransferase RlmN [Deltaproteobacteria bacterium]